MNFGTLFKLLMPLVHALDIHEYNSPIITIKEGNGWLLNGHINLVHMINLGKYENVTRDLRNELKTFEDGPKTDIITFHLNQIEKNIKQIKGKQKRSIDWIGSAWKWLAGSPDAADWNKILESEDNIIHNNNQQYRINRKLLNITDYIISKYNQLTTSVKNNLSNVSIDRIQDLLLHKTLILKQDIHELIRASQMARTGIVNTNLLDDQEIQMLLNEEVSLPYQNEIEALEYATPSVLTNNSIFLYVISIPKIQDEIYNHIHILPTITNRRRVDLQYKEVLLNKNHILAIKGHCSSNSNFTICDSNLVTRLPEEACLTKLLRGGAAECIFQSIDEEVISRFNEDTIFLTNFKGLVKSQEVSKELNGTYLLKFFNETVNIKGQNFTSKTTTKIQLLPSILSSARLNSTKVDVHYLHHLHLQNIVQLKDLHKKSNLFIISNIVILILLSLLAITIWKHLTQKLKIPDLKPPIAARTTDLRDADI